MYITNNNKLEKEITFMAPIQHKIQVKTKHTHQINLSEIILRNNKEQKIRIQQ